MMPLGFTVVTLFWLHHSIPHMHVLANDHGRGSNGRNGHMAEVVISIIYLNGVSSFCTSLILIFVFTLK